MVGLVPFEKETPKSMIPPSFSLSTCPSFRIPPAKLDPAQCPFGMPLWVKVTILCLLLELQREGVLTISGSLRDPVRTSQMLGAGRLPS